MRNRWTREELAILKGTYEKLTIVELQELLPGRSPASIYSRAYKEGLNRPITYTPQEVDAIVEGLQGSRSLKTIDVNLHNRSLTSIYRKVGKVPQSKRERRSWTLKEDKILLDNQDKTSGELAMMLGGTRNTSAVTNRRRMLASRYGNDIGMVKDNYVKSRTINEVCQDMDYVTGKIVPLTLGGVCVMLEIKELSDVRGNNVVIYSIKSLLEKGVFPHFALLTGHMGVGKSSVARLIAEEINGDTHPTTVYNFGLRQDMEKVESDVFKMNPGEPRVFIFEELHGLDKSQQTALLTMLDKQPDNVYIVCTTTESHRILNTIKSRAQRWDFKLLGMRQLSQLLDDYLQGKNVELTGRAKSALLKSCHGVPRDLLKNIDLALSGDFNANQLEQLLGHVSEDMIYTTLCALKSSGTDFSTTVANLLEESADGLLAQFRDFFTRYLLERKGIEGSTLGSNKISVLDSLFSSEELERIGRTLIRATNDTLALELSILNLELTRTTATKMVGQQIDKVASNTAGAVASASTSVTAERRANATVTRTGLSTLAFGSSEK